MKTLNKYINEALIKKDTKLFQYKYFPTTKDELRSILEQRLENNKSAYLNDIDVSQITDMTKLFVKLDPHDIDISKWNISNVIDMYWMFYECKNFTGKGLENWNFKKCRDTRGMFFNCKNFDCNVSKWNISNVKYICWMFDGCTNFKGNGLDKWKLCDLEEIPITGLFNNCPKLDCNLSKWDVSNVTDMKSLFDGCTNFKGVGLENWEPTLCEDMFKMFKDCINLNCDLSKWNCQKLGRVDQMFDNCTTLEKNNLIPDWYINFKSPWDD